MDQSSITQNRRSRRSPVLLTATVEVNGGEAAVVLRNLSSEGALIEGRDLPSEGDTTVFRRKELTVVGRVAWVEGRYAGLAFDRKLDKEELLRHVPKPKQQQPLEQRFRRPGLACEPLSDAERKMIQMWMNPIPQAER